jgi:hypothetical protein
VPVALVGGVVSGTWERDGTTIRLAWFREAGAAPRKALRDEVARLSRIAGQELALEVSRSERRVPRRPG